MSRNRWMRSLADAIEDAQDGDAIVVASKAEKEIAERAATRMRPDIDIVFVVEERRLFNGPEGVMAIPR